MRCTVKQRTLIIVSSIIAHLDTSRFIDVNIIYCVFSGIELPISWGCVGADLLTPMLCTFACHPLPIN